MKLNNQMLILISVLLFQLAALPSSSLAYGPIPLTPENASEYAEQIKVEAVLLKQLVNFRVTAFGDSYKLMNHYRSQLSLLSNDEMLLSSSIAPTSSEGGIEYNIQIKYDFADSSAFRCTGGIKKGYRGSSTFIINLNDWLGNGYPFDCKVALRDTPIAPGDKIFVEYEITSAIDVKLTYWGGNIFRHRCLNSDGEELPVAGWGHDGGSQVVMFKAGETQYFSDSVRAYNREYSRRKNSRMSNNGNLKPGKYILSHSFARYEYLGLGGDFEFEVR